MVIVGSLPGRGSIVQRGHRAFHHGPFNATLNGLMMQPKRLAHRKKRRVFPIGQQNPRPFDPARRLGSRLRYRPQSLHIRIFFLAGRHHTSRQDSDRLG
jgi:hypothetical protein